MTANETTATLEGGPTRCFTLGASIAWKGDMVQNHNFLNLRRQCERQATGS